MKTLTKGTLRTLGLSLVVLVGTGVASIAVANTAEELMANATSDEVYFAQQAFRIGDTKLIKMTKNGPIQSDVSTSESTSSLFVRTTLYKEKKGEKLQLIGEILAIDFGKTGQPTYITVKRGERLDTVSTLYSRMSTTTTGDWVVVSQWERKDRTITIPKSLGITPSNMRTNGMFLSALDELARRSAAGKKVTEFTMTTYTELSDGTAFTVVPTDGSGVIYKFFNGVLQ